MSDEDGYEMGGSVSLGHAGGHSFGNLSLNAG